MHPHSWFSRHCLDAVAQFPGHYVCVCVLTLGLPEDRVGFWQELIVVARRLLVMPTFGIQNSRSRSQDDLIVPLVGWSLHVDQSTRSSNT